MAIAVRPMRSDEARIFLDIHSRAIRGLAAAHYPPAVIEAWAIPPTEANAQRLLQNPDDEIRLIAERDGEPVGLGSLVVRNSELRACYVVPEASRMGVGSAVVKEIEWLAVGHGLAEIRLTASINAEAFYLAQGYEVVERIEHVLRSGQRMAAVTMRRGLLGNVSGATPPRSPGADEVR
jgi:putative acetyltransferase